jgi:hypothetical protein
MKQRCSLCSTFSRIHKLAYFSSRFLVCKKYAIVSFRLKFDEAKSHFFSQISQPYSPPNSREHICIEIGPDMPRRN